MSSFSDNVEVIVIVDSVELSVLVESAVVESVSIVVASVSGGSVLGCVVVKSFSDIAKYRREIADSPFESSQIRI